jgi:arsenite/tail-anchored protein-transporting ATPase
MSDARALHFFGGKGGVGKTTLATAFALNLAEKFPKEKVLLVSADGSRTLSDLLKKNLSATPTMLVPGKGDGGLSAAEWEASVAMPAFLERYEPALRQAVVKGAVLSEDELQTILVQSFAGLEEVVFLLGLQRELEDGTWNRIVVDTAPTAHMLRVLEAPAGLRKFLGLVRSAEGKSKKDAAPTFLDEVGAWVDKLIALLKDPARTSFHMVALPEPVPEAQTRMYFSRLVERGIPVAEFLVNQVEDREGCPACQGRRGLQAPHVRKLQGLDKNVSVQLIAKREIPPRGLDELKKLAKEWASGKETKSLAFAAAEGPPALVRAPSMPPIAAPPIPPTRLIFFVGRARAPPPRR